MHMTYYSESLHRRVNNPGKLDLYELSPDQISDGQAITLAIRDPASLGHPEWNDGFNRFRPYSVGNRSNMVNGPHYWYWVISSGDAWYLLNGCESLYISGEEEKFERLKCPNDKP